MQNGLWYGYWDEWLLNHKVVFDGIRKLILVNPGITSLDIKQDLYSDWKEWCETYDYLKFLPAFRSAGGDPTTPGKFIGSSFFLLNGWRIQSWVGTHELTLNGNLYVDGSGSAFAPYDLPRLTPSFNTSILQERSNLSELIVISGSGGTSGSFLDADRATLNSISAIVNNLPDSGSFSTHETILANNAAKIDKLFATNIIGEGISISGSLEAVTTTLSGAADNVYKNMFILVSSGTISVTRKIDVYESATGKFFFDCQCDFVPEVSRSVYLIPGYDPRTGHIL